MDLSGFKKIAHSKTHTTLRHEDGHELKVAHSALSKEQCEQLAKLPVRKYAEGTPDGPVPYISPDPASLATAGQTVDPSSSGQVGAPAPQGQNILSSLAMKGSPGADANVSATSPDVALQRELASEQDPYGLNKMVSDTRSAMQQGHNAIAGIGRAEGQIAKDQADIASSEGHLAMDRARKMSSALQENLNERKAWMEAVADGKINPHHYLDSMDTGHRIMTGIGLFLSGAGQSMHNTAFNPALEMLNKNIDRDIAAQQTNLGIKKSLLEANYKQFGDIGLAADMTRIQMKDAVALQMQAAALKQGNPLAVKQAALAQSKWDVEASQKIQEITQKQVTMKAFQGAQGNPEAMLSALRVLNPAAAKEIEGRYIPGVGMATIPVEQKVRDELAIRNELDQKLSKLERFAKEHEGTTLDRGIVNQGRTLAQDVQDVYRRANGQGVFREGEAKFVNSMISADPTSFWAKGRTLPGYEQIRRGNQVALQNRLRSVGIKPKTFDFSPAGKK
jgi:hypothetical protein